MHKLVNILMIAIIVSCPMRCMTQGCGSYNSACCDNDLVQSNCCCPQSTETPPTRKTPSKCQCKCFCSGVIVANSFEIQTDEFSQPVFQSYELNQNDALQLASGGAYHPPDSISDSPANLGRQLRCMISSFVI